VMGILYIGTAAMEQELPLRPDPAQFTSNWKG